MESNRLTDTNKGNGIDVPNRLLKKDVNNDQSASTVKAVVECNANRLDRREKLKILIDYAYSNDLGAEIIDAYPLGVLEGCFPNMTNTCLVLAKDQYGNEVELTKGIDEKSMESTLIKQSQESSLIQSMHGLISAIYSIKKTMKGDKSALAGVLVNTVEAITLHLESVSHENEFFIADVKLLMNEINLPSTKPLLDNGTYLKVDGFLEGFEIESTF
jgi:hypothetical protein